MYSKYYGSVALSCFEGPPTQAKTGQKRALFRVFGRQVRTFIVSLSLSIPLSVPLSLSFFQHLFTAPVAQRKNAHLVRASGYNLTMMVMDEPAAKVTAVVDAEDGALRVQLATLEAQWEQLASLLGDDPKGPLLQLQVKRGADCYYYVT